ncbi:hypothetical protein [Adlercreutzia shanghongiae]|uniref:Uncharacterized protein n=1 Tax=Adlercreutzia shanghongiae TaxID=3111773 RepID=A0ABU6IWM2_9ACTN|nr:hypothetical protein [Adlercreutzia sp. R22]MEC4294236.1 hypothetical protein [Adlercreutzia sp. R22]
MPTATKDAEIEFRTIEELKRQALNGRETLRPDSTTGITVLPPWMDAPEDEGLYDDLACAALNSSDQDEVER